MLLDFKNDEKVVVGSFSNSQLEQIVKYQFSSLRLSEEAQEYLKNIILSSRSKDVKYFDKLIAEGIGKRYYSYSDADVIRRNVNMP